MKHWLKLFLICAILNSCSLYATEVIYCFDKPWAHPDNSGLALNRGQVIELCQGAKDATEVLTCFLIAYKHPDNDGLGLNRGQAIALCKRAKKSGRITQLFCESMGT